MGADFYMAVLISCVWAGAAMQKHHENAKKANGIQTNQPKVRSSSFVFCFPAFLANTTCCWVRITMLYYKQIKVKGQWQELGEHTSKGSSEQTTSSVRHDQAGTMVSNCLHVVRQG